MTKPRWIELRGASEHNLCDLDVDIPLHQLTVVCGVSGSGKTSLALDTLFAEGQRRYIESFSAYTRQFLARIEKPHFRSLNNLPPSLSMTRGDYRTRNNRSTVGTASELMEPMRILFSLIAKPFCRSCGKEIVCHTPHAVASELSQMPPARAMLCFEFAWKTKVDLSAQLFDLQAAGFIRVILSDSLLELSGDRKSWGGQVPARGTGLVVVERFRTGDNQLSQSLTPAIELAFDQSPRGIVALVESLEAGTGDYSREVDGKRFRAHRYASELRCEACQIDYPASEPRLFNFNSPIGACPSCTGFGEVSSIDMDKVIPDRTLSLRDGAIAPWRTPSYSHELEELSALADDYGLPMDIPVSKLTKKQWSVVQHGIPGRRFGGLDGFFAWLERKKYKMHVRAFLARWRTYAQCSTCNGARLSPDALVYLHEGGNFSTWCSQSMSDLRAAIERLQNSSTSESFPDEALGAAIQEVESRLRYLDEVGLGYLSLNRTMHTLSGGEAQRVHLTTLLGSDLVDMLYVLDEPTVGLHPSDTSRVAMAVQRLVDRGNTVILIEHEPYLLFRANHVIEIGPGAGEQGGRICYSGTPKAWERSNTLTSRYLFGTSDAPPSPRNTNRQSVRLEGAVGRNLQVDEVAFPVRCLIAVVGVSGSGKSSLVMETLVPAVFRAFGQGDLPGLPYRGVSLADAIEGCVAIDQSPIAKSIRSTPATFTKAMDEIRSVFGTLPEARGRGMTDSHFSFNSSAGRCPECEGLGFTVVDMQFMADIRLTCTHCGGTRYRPEILQVRYRELSISQVLEMSISAAYGFFRGEPKVRQRLQAMLDIGLGYLPLGQSLSALSSGESMRLKLAAHLQDKRNHLIVMDEPTTGLHFSDIERLLSCLNVLIDRGNSIIVVEHNEQIIRSADWIIEMGPGPGPAGGRILHAGPRDVYFRSVHTPTTKALAERSSISDLRS